MGPPLFRGGHHGLGASFTVPVSLQWGHLSLEVVISGASWPWPNRRWLQWGHLSLEVVMVTELPEWNAEGKLQWGHLSLEVVMLMGLREDAAAVDASMGPPLFRGGHAAAIRSAPSRRLGFNGATSL